MATTSTIPLTVDGVRLDTYAYNIETIDGRLGIPGVRGSNPEVPSRSGALWNPSKVYDTSSIALRMWVIGADVDGLIPGGSSQLAEFRKNVDALSLLFSKRTSLLDVRQTWPSGVRQALCEVLQAVDLSAKAIQPQAKFSVLLEVPGTFWQDVSTADYVGATNLTSGTTITMATYDGATAPMEDHIIVVRGPATNPRITDTLSSSWVQYNGTIAAGTDWQVDVGNWTSKTGSALLFGAGGSNVIGTTSSGGGTRFCGLTPRAGGPQILFTATGVGAATQVQARGRRKYLS